MRIGVDLGGTKIEAAALDSNGAIVARERVPSPQDDYQATLTAIASLVHDIETKCGETGTVGIGIPGAISPATGLIKNANSTWLIGEALDKDLSQQLDRPVRLENDANCFTLSEAIDGAASGCGTVFGVILGTGVGGGIVINGAPLSGPNAICGEWGHNALPRPEDTERPGAVCYCGLHGCIETFLSGAGLVRSYCTMSGTNTSGVTAEEVAISGNPAALQAIDHYADRLARALASVINVLDPDAIVLGGGLSNIDSLYARVPQLWEKWIFSDQVRTRLLKNTHGDSSGVRGAAWLWPNRVNR